MDEEGLEENGADDSTGFGEGTAGAVIGAAGGVAAGIAGGTMAASVSVTGSTPAFIMGKIVMLPKISVQAETGSLAAALIYCVFGVLFLAMTSAFKVMAQNGRKHQEAYFNTADEIMKYDFKSKMEEVDMMNQEITNFTEQATELTKAANIQMSAANSVAAATSASNQSVSVAASAVADEGAASVIDDLDELDSGILDNLPRLDQLYEEIAARKEMFFKIKQELPKFEQNRKDQIKLMWILTGGAALAALAGGIGLACSWTNYLLAPAAMALFILGIAAFAASAIVAACEISPQNKAKDNIKDENDKTQASIDQASSATAQVAQVRNAGLMNEAAVLQMGEEAREEDANVNVTGGEQAI